MLQVLALLYGLGNCWQ